MGWDEVKFWGVAGGIITTQKGTFEWGPKRNKTLLQQNIVIRIVPLPSIYSSLYHHSLCDVEGTLSSTFIISVSPENVTIKESLKEECFYRLVKLPKLATRRQPRSTLEVPWLRLKKGVSVNPGGPYYLLKELVCRHHILLFWKSQN